MSKVPPQLKLVDQSLSERPNSRGRPRDPDLERRVFDVALDLYGREGWAGFGFDVIAREAGVGKNALYRRWPTKGALLRDMLKARWVSVENIDNGNLRDDLRALAHMLLAHMTGPLGVAGLQLRLDIVRYEVVSEALAVYLDDIKRSARDIVRRAVTRGELPEDTSTTLVLDVISGSVTTHVTSVPEYMRDEIMAGFDTYIDRLVDLVCRGLAK